EAALAQLRPTPDRQHAGERLHRELATVERELENLGRAIATTGALPSLVAQVQAREQQRERLRHDLAGLDQMAQVASLDLARLEREVRAVLDDWRALLLGHVAQARQILRKLVDGRLRFRPEGRGFTFEGTGRVEPILSGTVLPKAVVAPTGFEPVFESRPCFCMKSSRATACLVPKKTTRLKHAGFSGVDPTIWPQAFSGSSAARWP